MIGRLAMLVVGAGALVAQDQQPRSQPGWPCVGSPDPAYFKVAEATGGQVFLFDRSEAGHAAIPTIAARRHEETLFRAAGSLVDGRHEFAFPVDSTVESVMLSVSLQCLESVDVITPSGKALKKGAAGEFHEFRAGRIVTLPQPEPGSWRVRVAGRGMFFLVVKAKSDLSLDRVEFVREAGFPGHEGMFPTHEPPRASIPQWLTFRLTGEMSDVHATIVSSPFETIGALRLRESSSSSGRQEFLAQVTPPTTAFRVVVSGVDASGLPFQRVHAPMFEPVAR